MERRDRQLFEKRLRSATRAIARGRLKSAARQALRLADNTEIEPTILNRVGDLLISARRVDRAVALFERVAEAYADEGFWLKAIAIYKKILRWTPQRHDIERRLTILYQLSGLPSGRSPTAKVTAGRERPALLDALCTEGGTHAHPDRR